MPVSAVLARDEIMLTIKPGQHGSTYGGNPLACKVAMTALEVLKEEKMTENAFTLGEAFRERMGQLVERSELVSGVRGRGLLNALLINDTPESTTAWDICVKMKDNGLVGEANTRKHHSFCTASNHYGRGAGGMLRNHRANHS